LKSRPRDGEPRVARLAEERGRRFVSIAPNDAKAAVDIESVAADIDGVAADVDGVAADIVTATVDIATVAADIATATFAVADVAADVVTGAADIARVTVATTKPQPTSKVSLPTPQQSL
jgi:hypothetical protein